MDEEFIGDNELERREQGNYFDRFEEKVRGFLMNTPTGAVNKFRKFDSRTKELRRQGQEGVSNAVRRERAQTTTGYTFGVLNNPLEKNYDYGFFGMPKPKTKKKHHHKKRR